MDFRLNDPVVSATGDSGFGLRWSAETNYSGVVTRATGNQGQGCNGGGLDGTTANSSAGRARGPADGTGIREPLPLIVKAAIDQALARGRKGRGCLICFAAGNGDEPVEWDGYASYPRVLAVAATTDQDRRAWYSDWGKAIALAAPSSGGRNGIWTTDVRGRRGYNPRGDWTGDFGGTSAACPLVAGVAALVLSVNPRLRAPEVRDILQATADKVDLQGGRYDRRGWSPYYGWGRVNAARAVREAKRRKSAR